MPLKFLTTTITKLLPHKTTQDIVNKYTLDLTKFNRILLALNDSYFSIIADTEDVNIISMHEDLIRIEDLIGHYTKRITILRDKKYNNLRHLQNNNNQKQTVINELKDLKLIIQRELLTSYKNLTKISKHELYKKRQSVT